MAKDKLDCAVAAIYFGAPAAFWYGVLRISKIFASVCGLSALASDGVLGMTGLTVVVLTSGRSVTVCEYRRWSNITVRAFRSQVMWYPRYNEISFKPSMWKLDWRSSRA